MTSSRPRALLDTTVFCGALVKPTGANMRILLAGNGGLFYEPIIAQSIVAEFISRAVRGLGRGPNLRRYTPEEVALFIELCSRCFLRKTAPEPVGRSVASA